MKIQDAVARLERAGDENSKATQKLHEAVRVVACLIEENAPKNTTLPRGYKVIKITSNVGSCLFLTAGQVDEYDEPLYVDGCGSYLHGDFHAWTPAQTRTCSLRFAKDIAEGLLDEISAFLASRKAESEQAAGILATKI